MHFNLITLLVSQNAGTFSVIRMLPATKFEIDMREVDAPRNIIVDCDAGIDDALALIILLAGHADRRINIKAITCVNGNTKVDNVVRNVFRTLHVCNCKDVSIYP